MTDVLLAIGIAAFFIFRFVLAPWLRNPARDPAIGPAPGRASITKLAVVRFLGNFAGLIAAGALIGKLLSIGVNSVDVAPLVDQPTRTGLDTVAAILTNLQIANSILLKLGWSFGVVTVLLLGLGLLYWLTSSAYSVDAAISKEIAKLRKRAMAGTLDDLPENFDMSRMREHIAEARAKGLSTGPLYDTLLHLDLLRRIDPSLLHAPGPDAPVQPLWRRTARSLISSRLFNGLGRIATVVAALATVTLVPASLVFVSKDLSDAVAQKIIRLQDAERDIDLALLDSDLQTELTDLLVNTHDDFESADVSSQFLGASETEIRTWCDPGVGILSKSDCEVADEFARQFEAAWLFRLVTPPTGQTPYDQPPDRDFSDPVNSQSDSRSTLASPAEILASARQDWARRQILSASVAARPTPSVNITAIAQHDDEGRERAVLHAELVSRSESRPLTILGARVRDLVRHALAVRPGAIEIAADSAPLSPAEITVKSASLSIGALLGVTGLEELVPGPAGVLVRGGAEGAINIAVEDRIRKADSEYLDKSALAAAKAQLIAALKNGGLSPDAAENLARFLDPRTLARYRQVMDQVTPPDVSRAFAVDDVPQFALQDGSESTIASNKVATELGESFFLPDSNMDILSSYSSIFPGVHGQAAGTLHARILQQLYPDLAERQFGPLLNATSTTPDAGSVRTIVPTDESAAARTMVSRARSYSALRGYARVGGVLIGRAPDPDPDHPSLSIDRFTHSILPGPAPGLELRLTHDDDAEVVLGPYDPAIAHLALSYAADGRPLAVTIIRAGPLEDRKILLHPALLDTGLGCRTIQLDRIISSLPNDGFRALLRQATDRAFGLIDIYRHAWAIRTNAVTTELDPLFGIDTPRKLSTETPENPDLTNAPHTLAQPSLLGLVPAEQIVRLLTDEGDQIREPSEIYARYSGAMIEIATKIQKTEIQPERADAALRALRDDPHAALKPLRRLPAYFDSHLVGLIERCSANETPSLTIRHMLACVRTNSTMLQALQHFLNPHFSGLAPPPKPELLYGVREHGYTLTPDLDFARRPITAEVGPLRFMAQIAMSSPPYLATNDRPWYENTGDQVTGYLGPEPWELEELDTELQDSVIELIDNNADALAVFEDMADFTVLQRLFRAALDGRLGPEFPTENLVRLASETARHVNPEPLRTFRWLASTPDNNSINDDPEGINSYNDRVTTLWDTFDIEQGLAPSSPVWGSCPVP